MVSDVFILILGIPPCLFSLFGVNLWFFKKTKREIEPYESAVGDVEYVYKEIRRRKIELDVITFNVMVNWLCKVGKLNKVGDVIEDMKVWGFSPNVVTYNTLIDGYCKMGRVGKMDKAESILKDIVANQVCPNEVTYNILVDGFCKDENV